MTWIWVVWICGGLGWVWWMRREPMTRRQMLDRLREASEDLPPPRSIYDTSDGREVYSEWMKRKHVADAKRKASR